MRMSGTTSERQFHNARSNTRMKLRHYATALFAVLAVCLAAPAAFAQTAGGAAPDNAKWVAILRICTGESLGRGVGRDGSQSRSGRRHSEHADFGAGADRIDGVVYVRHHLHQSEVAPTRNLL